MAYWRTKPPNGVAVNPTHPLARDAVALWVFNNLGGCPFDKVTGVRGLASSNIGYANNALQLAGGAGTTVSAVRAVPPGTVSGTWTVLCRFLGYDFATNARKLVSTRATSDNSFDMMVQAGGGTIHADIGTGSAWLSTAADATFTFTAGNWYTVAYAVTATGYTIYAASPTKALASIGSGSWASNTPLLWNSTHDFFIGCDTGDATRHFNGLMDYVYVYRRTLSLTELQALVRDPYGMFLPPTTTRFYSIPAGVRRISAQNHLFPALSLRKS